MDQSISVEMQLRYFRFSELMKKKNNPPRPLSDEMCFDLYALLYNPNQTEHEKKYELLMLATSKNAKAFRLLKDFVENDPDIGLREWAGLALMDCQLSLESELSGEQQIYISTGLGGKGEKFRFSVLLTIAETHTAFEDYQKHIIEQEAKDVFEQYDCELESMKITDCYVLLRLLIPLRAADITKLIDKIIAECNQYGNFMSVKYTISNVNELTDEYALSIVNQNRTNEDADGDY